MTAKKLKIKSIDNMGQADIQHLKEHEQTKKKLYLVETPIECSVEREFNPNIDKWTEITPELEETIIENILNFENKRKEDLTTYETIKLVFAHLKKFEGLHG